MYRYIVQRSSSQVARQCSHAARSLTSLSTTSQKWSVERSRLHCLNTIKRSLATNDDIRSTLKNDLKRSINSSSSPIQEHERWKSLSVEEQQFFAPDLLDAWIRYHADLSAFYHEDETKNDSKLSEMIDSAHRAHSVLDRLYPQWSPRRFGKTSEEKNDPAAIASANQILALWASTAQAGHRRSSLRKELRGIPQRAQFLWQQLPPSIDSSNALLQTWAYSHEHWRGTRAQSIFDTMTSPNAESYRLMIRAWAFSGERRGAFTATGFLRRMLRLLDEGNRDMEPSIDEYRIVLDSWTRAK
ncbi:hypothetical protein FisN_1Hh350 [Fistulifera solaris]|uniref:Uncharacterized protein n=1 Tax=Fistulifera solaris TaxID=1519565 RepID=A0A1Z5JA18_FISSO|nr:hypothetical protein FisN_1Hh350 [Fistulifera solaris]|eukprot:GAX10809.1 hypothetical protein FisN_1Hh350 [Fistulifera solaris]